MAVCKDLYHVNIHLQQAYLFWYWPGIGIHIRIYPVPSKHLVDEASVDKTPGYLRIRTACWGREFAEFADVQCPRMLIYYVE